MCSTPKMAAPTVEAPPQQQAAQQPSIAQARKRNDNPATAGAGTLMTGGLQSRPNTGAATLLGA
jgi:hypothetical protein